MCVIVKNVWNIWIFAQKNPESIKQNIWIFWRENSKFTSVILTSKYFCWCSSKYFMVQKSILGPGWTPTGSIFFCNYIVGWAIIQKWLPIDFVVLRYPRVNQIIFFSKTFCDSMDHKIKSVGDHFWIRAHPTA